MAFVDLMNFRHASPAFFHSTTQWETPFVDSFLKSCDMLVADKLFRNLIPNSLATYDYLLRLRRRCETAGNLANYLVNHRIPSSNELSSFQYAWLDTTIIQESPLSIEGRVFNADKLKHCLLLHSHFFESLHAGLANHFAVEKQESQPRPEVSAFLQVEAAILSQYTPNAINRLLGIHELLLEVIESKTGYGPPKILLNPNEEYIFQTLDVDPFLFGGHPALEDVFRFALTHRLERLCSRLHQATATSTEALSPCVPIPRQVLPPLELEMAKKVSSILPSGYVRNLGLGWTPFVDRENASKQFTDYVLSAKDDDDDMLVQDIPAFHSEANANPEALPSVASECPPASSAIIPITRFTRRLRRPNRPCALKRIGRHWYLLFCPADTYFRGTVIVAAWSYMASANVLVRSPQSHPSSAPFVISHSSFDSQLLRFQLLLRIPAFAFRTVYCTTPNVRPRSSIMPWPVVSHIQDWADLGRAFSTLTTGEFPCIIDTFAIRKSFGSIGKRMELGRYHT